MHDFLKSFSRQVSWDGQLQHKVIGGIEFLQSDCCVYLPTLPKDAKQNSQIAKSIASRILREPALVVGNSPTQKEVESLCHNFIKDGILLCFIDPPSQVFYGRFLLRALEGIDRGRTLSQANVGRNPVFEWE